MAQCLWVLGRPDSSDSSTIILSQYRALFYIDLPPKSVELKCWFHANDNQEGVDSMKNQEGKHQTWAVVIHKRVEFQMSSNIFFKEVGGKEQTDAGKHGSYT